VLDAEPETNALVTRINEGMSSEFRASLAGMANPYGDGHAAETIVRVLTSTPLAEALLVKHAPVIDA
jgi:UDP-N-acetylglucosamine 2-epimerase